MMNIVKDYLPLGEVFKNLGKTRNLRTFSKDLKVIVFFKDVIVKIAYKSSDLKLYKSFILIKQLTKTFKLP